MYRNDGTTEALAQRERLVENTMECREDPNMMTGRGCDVTPERVLAR